jgi:hypothetical protein
MEELHQRINAPHCAYQKHSPEDDEELIKPPNVNAASSKQHKNFKRILVDSRNRDFALYPSANNFVQILPVPIRAVRSIALTDARIPVVDAAAYLYSVICLPELSGNDLVNTRDSSQFAPGALAVIPMIPSPAGGTHTYYQAYPGQRMGGSGGGWRLEFPMGITLSQIRIQILVYMIPALPPPAPPPPVLPGWSTLLPIVNAVPPVRDFATNLYITLEIEHDV